MSSNNQKGAYPQPDDFVKQTQLKDNKDPQPGLQNVMKPLPVTSELESSNSEKLEPYKAAGKLQGKVAIITGGDSGIGRSAASMFAQEGADVAIVYLPKEEADAKEAEADIKKAGRQCLRIAKDVQSEENCKLIVNEVVKKFGKVNILVNNAAVQYMQEKIEDITEDQLRKTFATNIFHMFFMVKHALPHMTKGDSIINTTSVVAYKGSPHLLDYSSTKGAITSFTRSLALQLAPRGIRVNGVAPGPIWTALQPVSRPEDKLEHWAKEKVPPLGRVGQPAECGPAYVFLASSDSSFFTGQILHPNGGMIVNA